MMTPPPGSHVLPEQQYLAGLDRKRMASGVLFRDASDRVLLVEPTYKPNWEIPGGAVEAGESPWAASAREVAEELGWKLQPRRLLVVDHVHAENSRPEGVAFVFDGGILTDEQVATMVPAVAEIRSVSFHSLGQARQKVRPLLADRLTAAVVAARNHSTVLCDHGIPVR